MSYYSEIGKVALGSRLRALSESLLADAEQVYAMYQVDLKPKWFPVFHLLSRAREPQAIMEIAGKIGQTHPSVIKLVREMSKAGVVTEQKDKEDKRKTLIVLTDRGRVMAEQIRDQYTDVTATVEEMIAASNHDLWEALEEFEQLLEASSLLERVRKNKKAREMTLVEIVPFEQQYEVAFRELNEEWIRQYFEMEESDRKALYNPQSYILDRGGEILVALYGGEPLGVCALIPMEGGAHDFELAKMAVSPRAQGKGLGYLLGKAIVDLARSKGAKAIYLESNSVLQPALSLYRKLGFKDVAGIETPYARCNVQMELIIA